MGNQAEALHLYSRSQLLDKSRLDHVNIGLTLHNLAYLHYLIGKHAKALPLYERSLAIIQDELCPDNPKTAWVLNQLAALHVAMGAHAKALPLYEWFLALHEANLGPDHLSSGTISHILAGLHQAMGEHAKAFVLYKRSPAGNEATLGPDHPRIKLPQPCNIASHDWGSALYLIMRNLTKFTKTRQHIFEICYSLHIIILSYKSIDFRVTLLMHRLKYKHC